MLFVRERTLMAQPFDATRLALTGNAVTIAERVAQLSSDRVGRFFGIGRGVLACPGGGCRHF